MNLTFACPHCARRLRSAGSGSETQVRCPGCGAVVSTPDPGPADPYAPPRAVIVPGRAAASWRFGVAIREGPAGIYKGALLAEPTPGGLVLYRIKDEVGRIGVGNPTHYDGGNRIVTTLDDGNEITLAVVATTFYQERLARDLAGFLAGDRPALVAADYKIPLALSAFALAPIAIGAAGMQGGAIGGGLGGGLAGGLIVANLAIVRRETWPVLARVGFCLATTAVGGVLFVVLFRTVVAGLFGG